MPIFLPPLVSRSYLRSRLKASSPIVSSPPPPTLTSALVPTRARVQRTPLAAPSPPPLHNTNGTDKPRSPISSRGRWVGREGEARRWQGVMDAVWVRKKIFIWQSVRSPGLSPGRRYYFEVILSVIACLMIYPMFQLIHCLPLLFFLSFRRIVPLFLKSTFQIGSFSIAKASTPRRRSQS